MRIVIQRVLNASVTINQLPFSEIERGLLILLGIEEADNTQDIEWLCKKIIDLRLFADAEEKMNLNLKEVRGEILVVSQFTLCAAIKKGNRPSYKKAARPDKAIPLYEYFITHLSGLLQKPVKTGLFGAVMQVSLINDGPVTILMDSKNRE